MYKITYKKIVKILYSMQSRDNEQCSLGNSIAWRLQTTSAFSPSNFAQFRYTE